MAGEIVLDLMRHGACEGGEILRGRTDSRLSDLGWTQMQSAAERVAGWQRVVSSPLARCRDFAEVTAAKHDVPLLLEDDLREMDFGAWDGLPLANLWQQAAKEVEAFWRDPENQGPPGGEPFGAFRMRLQAFLRRAAAAEEERWLVVTHGGVIRQLVAEVLQIPPAAALSLAIGYGGLTRLTLYPGASDSCHYQIDFINHLGDPSGF